MATSATAEPVVRRARTLRHRVVDDIGTVAPAEWDSILRPEDVQASHRFVRVCQEAGIEDAEMRHVLVYDDRGLTAVATLTVMSVRLELLATGAARSLVARARRWHPGVLRLRLAMCGLPVSFGESCLRVRRGAQAEAIVRLLAEELEAFAREKRASLLCFKEHSPGEGRELEVLTHLGYRALPSLATYEMPLRWRSFDQYVAAMRAGYRRQVRATQSQGRAAGLSVRVVSNVVEVCDEAYRLYGQVMDRAAFQLERLNQAFFRGLAGLGEEAQAVVVERRGRVVATAITLLRGGVATFLLAGIDYERIRDCPAYPNLVLAVVDHALRSGACLLRMGQTSDHLKTRLGALPERRSVFLRARSRHLAWLLSVAGSTLFPERPAPSRRVFRT